MILPLAALHAARCMWSGVDMSGYRGTINYRPRPVFRRGPSLAIRGGDTSMAGMAIAIPGI